MRIQAEHPNSNRLISSLGGGPRGLELPLKAGSSTRVDLHTLLAHFWPFTSSDPRDKVYALVGLTTARNDPDLVIDYTASVRQVYIATAKYIMASSGKLDFICSRPRLSNNTFDLPSWIPDWTYWDGRSGGIPCGELGVKPNTFNSASNTIARTELKQECQVLVAKGIVLSRVEHVGQAYTSRSRYSLRDGVGILILLNWHKLWKTIRPSVEVKEFIFPLFWGLFSHKKEVPEMMERILAAIATLAKEFCPEEIVDSELLALKERFHLEVWRCYSWMQFCIPTMRNRRFFISSTQLVGVGPASTEPGDIICILLGCYVPVILRPQGNYYKFLCEAYVYGYMYGKGIEELYDGKYKLEAFEIH